MTSKEKLPTVRTTRPLMTQKMMNSENPFAKSDSTGVLRTFANFSSDADTMVQSMSHGLGESQTDDRFETLSNISISDMRQDLPLDIDSLSEFGGAPNDEASLSSWKHPEELPYLDEDPSPEFDALGGGQGLSMNGQSEQKDCLGLQSIRDVELNERLDRMVFNARVSGVEKTLQLPWDSECFSGIFGSRDSIFPQVDSELVCFENPSQSTQCAIPGPTDDFLKLDHVQNCFESAISFMLSLSYSLHPFHW